MAADIARTARNQNFHKAIILSPAHIFSGSIFIITFPFQKGQGQLLYFY